MAMIINHHFANRPFVRSIGFVGIVQSQTFIGPSRIGRKELLPPRSKPVIENEELLIGDCVALFSYCCYKQIQAIVQAPDFPGLLAPLHFRPLRFLEFGGFSLTIIGTFVAVSFLTDGYSLRTSEKVKSLIENAFYSWLISMPVDASWLVLTAAIENGSLVGDIGWYDNLPLAARGIGEPWVTAAQILGLVCVWRSFYGTFLETASFRSLSSLRNAKENDAKNFVSTAITVSAIAIIEFIILHLLTKMNSSLPR